MNNLCCGSCNFNLLNFSLEVKEQVDSGMHGVVGS